MEAIIALLFLVLLVCTPITFISYLFKKMRKKDVSKQVKYLKRQGITFVISFVVLMITFGQNDESESVKPTITLAPTFSPSSEDKIISIKEQATELNYKAVFRNPDDYIGKYFVVDVKILTVENGSWLSGYEKAYKSYTNDEYNMWFGDMLYLVDHRKETDYGYVKILTDDIIRVWGQFDGLIETKNALNGTKGEEMSLNIIYTELISE